MKKYLNLSKSPRSENRLTRLLSSLVLIIPFSYGNFAHAGDLDLEGLGSIRRQRDLYALGELLSEHCQQNGPMSRNSVAQIVDYCNYLNSQNPSYFANGSQKCFQVSLDLSPHGEKAPCRDPHIHIDIEDELSNKIHFSGSKLVKRAIPGGHLGHALPVAAESLGEIAGIDGITINDPLGVLGSSGSSSSMGQNLNPLSQEPRGQIVGSGSGGGGSVDAPRSGLTSAGNSQLTDPLKLNEPTIPRTPTVGGSNVNRNWAGVKKACGTGMRVLRVCGTVVEITTDPKDDLTYQMTHDKNADADLVCGVVAPFEWFADNLCGSIMDITGQGRGRAHWTFQNNCTKDELPVRWKW